jgi:YD repeat-containing protein
MGCPDNTTVYAVTLTRLTFTGPDGTEYELRDQLTGGQPQGNGACNYLNPPSRGKVFVTSDGAAATFISDTPIQDYVIAPNPSPETYPSGYLMLRDGTRFRIQVGRVEWMRDRNGNKLTFGYDSNNRVQTITDSLNRVVTISRNTGPGTFDQITLKGFGGATRVVRVNYSSMSEALRSDYPSTLTYKTLFPELNGSNTGYHNPSVVSSITLPNNQQYLIKYNPYGEVARVVLPTGGAVEYDYAAGAGDYPSGSWVGYEGSWTVYRRVVERRVYPDSATGSAYAMRMTYSRTEAECGGCVKVDQFNNSGILLTRSKHYFNGSAAMSFLIGPTDYPSWKEGREFQTEEFASDGTTLLRRIVNTWQQPTAGSTWPINQAETNDSVKSNNPQITQSMTMLEPAQVNKVSKQTFGYDKYTNRTDAYEYDFGTGAAGSMVRRTHTDYLTSSYDTLNPSSANPDLNLTSHIRNLPTQVSIFDAAGVERARA